MKKISENTASVLFLRTKKDRIMVFIALFVSIPAVFWLVWVTGGIKNAYSHTMYIPIVLSGIFFGRRVGLVTAIVAGLVLGPVMPLDTTVDPALYQYQPPFNWLFRLLIFSIIGFLNGDAFQKLRKDTVQIEKLSSFNIGTNIPNVNSLRKIVSTLKPGKQTIITILINNCDSIIDVLGIEVYNNLLGEIYVDLHEHMDSNSAVIQVDNYKMWIVTPFVEIKRDVEKILSIINKTRSYSSIPLYVDFSLGVSSIDSREDCVKTSAYSNSDLSARIAQLNNILFSIYDEKTMQKREDYELLASFSSALENNQLFLVFQPKVDIKTLKTVGAEALLRWKHPEKGFIAPDKFIPLVEETKLIHQLTDWVIDNTIEKMHQMSAEGINIRISINISAINLYDPLFFERTMKRIETSGLKIDVFELELTESVLMINPEKSREILKKFADAGVHISIDDFGAGYSSLAYLSKFPIDTLKIDRYFIKDMSKNKSLGHIVKATIQLANQLGYKVVAEGVETQEALDTLGTYECDYAQGFFFSKPVSSDIFMKWYYEHNK